MSLTVKKNTFKYVSRIALIVLAAVVGIFVLRVAIWENNYYNEKEGSERAVSPFAGDMGSSEETIDEEVTEEQKEEYVVAADMPRYLSIPSLDIYNARVRAVGTLASGQMATPANIYDVGWWNGSSKPGTGKTAILDGHNGASQVGVFKYLPKLKAGDGITIEMGDGTILNYRVYDNIKVSLEEADKKLNSLYTSPKPGVESISLISCTGEWSQIQNTYLSRQFLRATLVSREEGKLKQ